MLQDVHNPHCMSYRLPNFLKVSHREKRGWINTAKFSNYKNSYLKFDGKWPTYTHVMNSTMHYDRKWIKHCKPCQIIFYILSFPLAAHDHWRHRNRFLLLPTPPPNYRDNWPLWLHWDKFNLKKLSKRFIRIKDSKLKPDKDL